MRCAVISHKKCWITTGESATMSAHATTGGFPIQIEALADLFDATRLVVPLLPQGPRPGERALQGRNLTVVPLTPPPGRGLWRGPAFVLWLIRNGPTLFREVRNANAIHAIIPGDVGTVGMILGLLMRKPLCVRYCGNWLVPEKFSDSLARCVMRRFAGGRNVMLATGGGSRPPSSNGRPIHWIFSTSLTRELHSRVRQPRSAEKRRGRLIIVCRQEARKGTAIVIESIPLILRRFPEATLDVVGTGSQLPALHALVDSLNLNGRVRFHGQVSHTEVMRLLGQAEIFCYPTTGSEGFSKAVLEALACGLPVVAPRVSSIPALLETGCGVLLPDVTPGAVASAVQDTLSDTHRYAAMSMQAVRTARQYSLERWRAHVGQLLEEAWGVLRAGV